MCALPSRFPVDPATRGAIVLAKQQLDQVCRFLGIDPNSPISDPGSPPNLGKIVRAAPPDPSLSPQPGFPVQLPQPPIGAFPPTGYRPSAEFLALLNTALNQSDVFLRTIESHVNQMVQGYQFQAEARQFRSNLLVLNQRVREGAPRREIEAALNGALRSSRVISTRIGALVGGRGGPVINQFAPRSRWSVSSARCCDDLGHRLQSTTKPHENQPLGTLVMLTTLFMLLTVTGQTPGPSGSRADFKPLPEPNKVAPEFAEILGRSEKAMAALGSFSVKVHVTAILEGPGSKTGSTSTQTILARRPDRFAVIADWAQLGEEQERPTLRVACDGRKLTTYFIPGRLYSEYDGPNPSAQTGHTAIIGSTLSGSGLDVLTRSDMRDFVLRQTSQAELRGKELVDGIDTLKFRVVYAAQELLMWIGPTNQPLLRRLEQTPGANTGRRAKADQPAKG